MRLYNRDIGRDVRELGTLVGDTIREKTSAAAFETVESLRTAAIAYREDRLDTRDPLREEIDGLSTARADVVARAFTAYFELINLAEERARIRALRDADQQGTLADGIEAAVEELAALDAETAQEVLDAIYVEPTFTAHPTEARRKTLKAKLRTIADHLEALDERLLTDDEEAQLLRAIDAEVTSLWGTRQVRERRPTPLDEARNVQWYLDNTLFDVIGEVYDELDRAVDAAFDEPLDVPTMLAFRSWAGADHDGNPYVTPDVTAQTLESQHAAALDRYRAELARLSGVVSQDAERIGVGDDFEASLAADRERFPALAEAATDRYPGEPYRQKVALMRERLDRVDDIRPGGYDGPAELLADLDVVAESLRANGDDAVVDVHLEPVRRRVETFGFTLAAVDLRDHREHHTRAVDEALAREGIDYRDRSEDDRQALLTEAVLQDEPIIDVADTDGLSDEASRTLDWFDRLADWQREYGERAIDRYCISMTEEPSHVLEVLFLADQAGVVTLPDYSGLDVVPLLETEYALSGARRIMGTLFENEAYRPALDARGGIQEIMLGYSDSNKENGFLAANWSLQREQRRLAAITDEHDVDLRLFHGRGGSISRGGGPMNEALLALPTATVTGEVRFTEQGEAIAEKYGHPHIAERNIEQMLNAQIRARNRAVTTGARPVREAWLDAVETMAAAARDAYRDLLETEGFVPYFERATPITVIDRLNLGSRPTSRTGERTVEDLRAIPWVFSWTQARCILPGWYGLGAGVDAYLEDGDLDTLREMYDEWPFFRTTLDNAARALAQTDLEIAAEYADLADPELRDRFFPRISAEYERSVECVTTIGERDGLITREWLEESLRRRNPYVDPLNLLQTHLLGIDDPTDAEERALRLTVKGIAAGMKNTG